MEFSTIIKEIERESRESSSKAVLSSADRCTSGGDGDNCTCECTYNFSPVALK
jgi:hypothetical protein